MRRHLLGPLERRIERPRPCHRHVRVGLVRAPIFVMQHLLGFGQSQNAVVGGHLVERALQRAFGAGAVVAADVDDQRVVELAHVLDRLDDAANLIVGIGGVAGKVLRLAGIEFLLDQGKRVPLRQVIRPGGELGVRRDHAEPLLVGEDLLAQLFPAHVELAFELVAPLLLRLVRRVGAAGHVIDEERLVGCGRVQAAHVLDGLVRQVGGEVVAGLADPGKNLGRVLIKIGRPLVGLAAHEPVEILESHADRPLVERPGRAVQIGGRVMVLAKPRGGITVVSAEFPDRGALGPMTES